MTTAELKQAYIDLYTKVVEIKTLIREGNRKTNEPHLSDESMELYEYYKNELKEKIEELTGEKIDFGYYTFY